MLEMFLSHISGVFIIGLSIIKFILFSKAYLFMQKKEQSLHYNPKYYLEMKNLTGFFDDEFMWTTED